MLTAHHCVGLSTSSLAVSEHTDVVTIEGIFDDVLFNLIDKLQKNVNCISRAKLVSHYLAKICENSVLSNEMAVSRIMRPVQGHECFAHLV